MYTFGEIMSLEKGLELCNRVGLSGVAGRRSMAGRGWNHGAAATAGDYVYFLQ